jgi:hypothetical protein
MSTSALHDLANSAIAVEAQSVQQQQQPIAEAQQQPPTTTTTTLPKNRRDSTRTLLRHHGITIASLSRKTGVNLNLCYEVFRPDLRISDQRFDEIWQQLAPFLDNLQEDAATELTREDCRKLFGEFLLGNPGCTLESIAEVMKVPLTTLRAFKDPSSDSTLSDDTFDRAYNTLVPLLNAKPGSRLLTRVLTGSATGKAATETDEQRKVFREWMERNGAVLISTVARKVGVTTQELEAYLSETEDVNDRLCTKIWDGLQPLMKAQHMSRLGRQLRGVLPLPSSRKWTKRERDIESEEDGEDVQEGEPLKKPCTTQTTTTVANGPNAPDVVDMVSRLIQDRKGVKVTVVSIEF